MIVATDHRFRLTVVVKMTVRLRNAVHPVVARSACRHSRRRRPLKRQCDGENERDDDSLNARHAQSLVHPAASRSLALLSFTASVPLPRTGGELVNPFARAWSVVKGWLIAEPSVSANVLMDPPGGTTKGCPSAARSQSRQSTRW